MSKFASNSKRRSKYNNIKCEADGIKFDSKREMRRYFELKVMQQQGIISNLSTHVSFKLEHPSIGSIKIKGLKRTTVSRFIPDFVYDQKGKKIIEDVKSPATANEKYFKLKRAIFEALYNTEVKIVL